MFHVLSIPLRIHVLNFRSRLSSRMPEGPELHLASRFVNKVCSGLVFSGSVEKSAVSKNREVPFQCEAYIISAVSRGKEVKLTLTPIKEEGRKEGAEPSATEPGREPPDPVDIVFRFGMSGSFELTVEEELPKHAHLKFFSRDRPRQVLSFVDPRRFGSWEVNGTWQSDRGPCVMFEYEKFRWNVLSNLSDKAFDRPICEVLLNQKYFNGIGNYLRAEVLFRLKVPPFEKARAVLEALVHKERPAELSLSKKIKLKLDNPDILELCHLLPMEVINLGRRSGHPLRLIHLTQPQEARATSRAARTFHPPSPPGSAATMWQECRCYVMATGEPFGSRACQGRWLRKDPKVSKPNLGVKSKQMRRKTDR
ncbi:endonuclease 8-like 1 isoform X3 [Narcine bancroftii]|uniref:endonuclease 8-like 1 isoform X3 n=1 Tax=Narcine bancroftii TaxID=1343680 RepID=UPI003831926C